MKENGTKKPIVLENDFKLNYVDKQNDTEESSTLGITISNATAKWTDGQNNNSLENINLTVTPGRLVAIIGPVGSGKVWTLYDV